MKLSKKDILRLPSEGQEFKTTIHYASIDIPEYMGIRRLEPVEASGKLSYEALSEHLIVSVRLSGKMILPCSITAVDVPYAFKTESRIVFGFKPDETQDILEISKDEVDLDAEFLGLIWMEVPAQIVSPDLKELPSGNGWEVLSEADYQKRKQSEPDERLAKLKEFNIKDE